MNAKRISARLIVATITVGATMSVAAPAWAATADPQSAAPEDMVQENLQEAQETICQAVEKANEEGVKAKDFELVGASSCPELGTLF